MVSKFIEEDICGFVWASLRLIGDRINVKETIRKNSQSWSYASQRLKIDKFLSKGVLKGWFDFFHTAESIIQEE